MWQLPNGVIVFCTKTHVGGFSGQHTEAANAVQPVIPHLSKTWLSSIASKQTEISWGTWLTSAVWSIVYTNPLTQYAEQFTHKHFDSHSSFSRLCQIFLKWHWRGFRLGRVLILQSCCFLGILSNSFSPSLFPPHLDPQLTPGLRSLVINRERGRKGRAQREQRRMDPIVKPHRPGKYRHLVNACSQLFFLGCLCKSIFSWLCVLVFLSVSACLCYDSSSQRYYQGNCSGCSDVLRRQPMSLHENDTLLICKVLQ